MIDSPPPNAPIVMVTQECIQKAANTYGIPPIILTGLIYQEGGKVGESSLNSNGTRDYGPMQINSVWLAKLKKKGITSDMLKNNGCLNVFVGAALLYKHAADTRYNWWKAVGNYHSKTPKHHNKYLYKVASKVQLLSTGRTSTQAVLNKINYQ